MFVKKYMKKLFLIFVFLFSFSITVIADDGRYQMETSNNPNFVWVIDTNTGEVKYCMWFDIKKRPKCTPFSETPDK